MKPSQLRPNGVILPTIMTPHFAALTAAYQLHYYFCFKTRYLHPLIAKPDQRILVEEVLQEVCAREGYHLLERNIEQDQLRMLVSLKPSQSASKVVQMLKGNTSRQFGISFNHQLEHYRSRTLWSTGYYARTSGKVDLEKARAYVDAQVRHHEYQGQWTESLSFRNPHFSSPVFQIAHSVCILNYHIVLATQQRLALFDEAIAPNFFKYAMAVGNKHGFAIDRMGVMPDHVHLTMEARPDISPEQCVLALLENTRYWMTKNYYGVLKQTNGWDVWEPSYYVGSVGDYSTAQVKQFLNNR